MHARLFKLVAWSLLAVFSIGCQRLDPDEADRENAQPRPGPAERATVKLSPQAQDRAGLAVETASLSRQPSFLAATGWLVAKPGTEVAIKAPATGFLTLPAIEGEIELGFPVKTKGQPLGEIQVVLSPQQQADLVAAKEKADVLIRQSLTSLELAQAQLERVQKSKGAVPGTRLADLREKVAHARAAYEETRQGLPFLPQEPYTDPLHLKPLPIVAPLAGRVVAVHVRRGQFVAQGDTLWRIADWSVLWVRVPVFELDLPRVQQHEPAQVEVPGTDVRLAAQPVDAPQPTLDDRRSVDRYYEMPNASGTLRVGQAVRVLLPTGRPTERIVLPRSAVLWDGMGAAWVYVQTGPHAFRRSRIELGPILQDGVVVSRGLDPGAKVVVTGAEALYGEQFQGEIPLEDEDD